MSLFGIIVVVMVLITVMATKPIFMSFVAISSVSHVKLYVTVSKPCHLSNCTITKSSQYRLFNSRYCEDELDTGTGKP